jgi:serine phosphatase RsbU (regulator of sigma subunit)/uncharacterized glyoxalase superfamily protein PhnB
MSEPLGPPWARRLVFRLDRESPYLALGHVTVFVRDQARSLAFYRDQLGFSVAQVQLDPSLRFVAVAPPDGAAALTLISPPIDSSDYDRIGHSTGVVFISEDVDGQYQHWKSRGVRFSHPPETQTWGGLFTTFEDMDGNSFILAGVDQVTRELEAQRRAEAERLESDRRSAQELEIARQVQARLFPQLSPVLDTLDYSGTCVQASQIGGDYYDFLDLGDRHFGLVIGDVSGKGLPAALLVTSLQASLRSQCAGGSKDPLRVLGSVNQLFFDNSPDSAYATVFFGEYDDRKRRLRYVNCGHPPALILRTDGRVDKLDATGTVVGLFAQWNASVRECDLLPGDTIVAYTDGITESLNEAGEEFGDQRLVETIRRDRAAPSQAIEAAILDAVRQFSPHEQADDRTVIVAKGK